MGAWGLQTPGIGPVAQSLQGFKGHSFDDPAIGISAQSLVSGTLYAQQIQVFNPGAVTQCAYTVTTAEVGGTAGQNLIGFYTADGQTQLGTTGDLSNAGVTGNWTVTGNKASPVSFFLPGTTYIWAVTLAVFVTTAPALRATGASPGTAFTGPFAVERVGTLGTGATALPASFAPSSVAIAASPLLWGIGVY